MTALINNLNQELEEKAKELNLLREELKWLKKNDAQRTIISCGMECKSLNLSVAVQFIHPDDAELAKKIPGLFMWDWLDSVYYGNVRPVEQVSWFENPSDSSRVVLYHYHPNGAAISNAFNEGKLIGESVSHIDLQNSPPGTRMDKADLTFVIFPKKGKGVDKK